MQTVWSACSSHGPSAVGLGVDAHRLDAQLARGTDDPQRDLAPVGDQDA